MRFFLRLCAIAIFLSTSSWAQSQPETPAQLVPAALIGYSADAGTNPYFFIVDKSQRELSVWQPVGDDFVLVKKVPADIGKNNSDKKKQGDHATPEGIYWLQNRLQDKELDFSQYGSLAFTTDYPNVFDKAESKTGNGIWLHAIPDNVPLTRGSKGCVVIRNDTIKDLQQYVTLRTTPLMIFDKVENLDKTARGLKKEKVLNFINSWKSSWADKNIATYMGFYHEQFKALGMNKKQWQKHKEKLANNYANIEVKFSPASMFNSKNQWVVRMVQDYKSDKYQDSGFKTLYVVENGESFQIIAEEFQALQKNEADLFKTASQIEPNKSSN